MEQGSVDKSWHLSRRVVKQNGAGRGEEKKEGKNTIKGRKKKIVTQFSARLSCNDANPLSRCNI